MRRILIAASLILPTLALPGHAASICGATVQNDLDEVRTFLGHFMAACEDRGACRAMSYQTVKDSGVPWTHRLAIMRSAKGAPWQLELTVDKGQIDVNEGYDLVIDRRESLRVPPEAIKYADAKNDYRLNDDLNELTITALAKGGSVAWNYTNAEDKKPASATMSLVGMRRAMRWINCMQKRAG